MTELLDTYLIIYTVQRGQASFANLRKISIGIGTEVYKLILYARDHILFFTLYRIYFYLYVP